MKEIVADQIMVGIIVWLILCGFMVYLHKRSKRKNVKVERSNCVMFDENGIIVFEKGIIRHGMILTEEEQVMEIEKIFNKSPEVHRIFVDAAVATVIRNS